MNEPERSGVGQQRALAALRTARRIAQAGIRGNRLFPDLEPVGLRLPDPVSPVTHLFATRHRNSGASARYVRELFEAVRSIDPQIRTIAIELFDDEGFRPIEADWSDPDSRLINHRDMRARLVVYEGGKPVLETLWEALPSALPWPWLRDILVPATVTAYGRRIPAFIQPFHWAVLAPLAGWLDAEFQGTGLAWSMYADGSELRTLTAGHQNHGGGIVPVSSRIAIVGRGMSGGLRAELARLGITCVISDVPTWTEHVDELYALVPDFHSRCGRALLYLMPHAAGDDAATVKTVRAIRRATDTVIEHLRRLPELADLRCFPVPAPVSGQKVVDFNPVNLVPVPLKERLALLLGRPTAADRQREICAAFRDIERSLARPVDLHFVDLSGIDPGTAGSLHCATVELRAFDPAS